MCFLLNYTLQLLWINFSLKREFYIDVWRVQANKSSK